MSEKPWEMTDIEWEKVESKAGSFAEGYLAAWEAGQRKLMEYLKSVAVDKSYWVQIDPQEWDAILKEFGLE